MARLTNYLGGTFNGIGFMGAYTGVDLEPSSYDTIVFYGGANGGIIDKVYGENDILTQDIFNSRASVDVALKWVPKTIILADFQGSLSGGNITGIDSPITTWLIYRIDDNSGIMKLIDEVPMNTISYTDYTTLKNHNYSYLVFGKNATQIADPLITDKVDAYYHGWYLIDIDNKKSYMFDLNLSGGDINQITNYNEYNTNLQYNAYSKGSTNFIEGQITALVLDDLCSNEQSVTILDDLREFIYSNRTKYLKDNKGRIYKVFTYDYKDTLIEPGITNEPRYVSFAFKECGDV